MPKLNSFSANLRANRPIFTTDRSGVKICLHSFLSFSVLDQ